MNDGKCSHGIQAPEFVMKLIPDSQAGSGRHKCPACAFHAGATRSAQFAGKKLENCKHGKSAPTEMLLALPDSQGGPGRHKCCVCAFAAGIELTKDLDAQNDALATEDRNESAKVAIPYEGGAEGTQRKVTVSVYERDPKNRIEALRLHGNVCTVCGFDFDRFYGPDLARGYIEIHHLISVSELKGKQVNPATDMKPVCSNCHSMAHRRRDKLVSIEEIKSAIAMHREKK